MLKLRHYIKELDWKPYLLNKMWVHDIELISFTTVLWQTVDEDSLTSNISNAFFVSVVPTFDSVFLYHVSAL